MKSFKKGQLIIKSINKTIPIKEEYKQKLNENNKSK